jgi:glycyl-tRNA synthetase beta chain
MDLPPEVMQVSMRVNQRYFALRDARGAVAPWFGFIANVPGSDGGAAIVAGNERVLRARFADARHFWDADRKQTLESRVAALDGVTFEARLGSQGERVRRLTKLAAAIAPLVGADPALAERAALLAKADLVTGMVGEFPELQGVMGRYYALHDHENAEVADAIRDHYAPKGPVDDVPRAPVSIAVALAEKIDTLAAFFAIGERPTGAGDPFALRRAALGVIRILRQNKASIRLHHFFQYALAGINPNLHGDADKLSNLADELRSFVLERLRVQLRTEGMRHDVLDAVLTRTQLRNDTSNDEINAIMARTNAVAAMLGTEDGANLLVGYRRAANILRIEERKDGPHDGPVEAALLAAPEESHLFDALTRVETDVAHLIGEEESFPAVMESLATLRHPLDAFFDRVTVNDPRPEIRRNRLRLLARVRAAMHLAADFSRLEG